MSEQNKVGTLGTEEERALLGAFIESHPYWTDIWDSAEITGWIKGELASVNLNTLFQLYMSGQVQHVWELIWSKGRHDLLNPLWTEWGDA
ncbi:MAG: hypothetical protein ACREBA_00980 [Nitrosotalea sp.]